MLTQRDAARARDEERAGREEKVCAEDGDNGCRKPEGPVRRCGIYEGEEEIRGRSEESANGCWTLITISSRAAGT